MTSSIVNNDLISSPDDEFNIANVEQPGMRLTKKMWTDTKPLTVPNVLDPDDSLMKKFQNALREHLVRVDNKLNSEILDLVNISLLPVFKKYKIKYNQ